VKGSGAVWVLAGKGLWAHKARLTLSVLAVVLGVAFIAGTLLLTDSLQAGIAALAPRGASATVRTATGLADETRPALPADVPARLRRLDGVRTAAGKVLGGVQMRPEHGSVTGPSLGLSWPEEEALSPLQLVAGQPPGGGQAAVSAGFARSGHVGVGDVVELATAEGSTRLRVSGIVRVNGRDTAGPASLAVLDLATARRLLGVPGYSAADVLADPEALTPARLAGLAAAGRVEVVDPRRAVQDDSAGVSGFLAAVAGTLRGFGALALAVGSFLIFNTLSMLAALRTREFGLLRVVGATPRQVGLLVVLEAAIIGAGASLLGAIAGVGAAAGLLAWLAHKDLLPAGLAPHPGTLAFAVAAGTAIAVAASLPAALRSGRVPPLRSLHDGVASSWRPRPPAAVAAAFAAVGGAMVLRGLQTADPTIVAAGAGLCLAGAMLVLPVVVRWLAVPLRAAGHLGITVRLGTQNAIRNQRRTAATVAALMVSLATVVAVATYARSAQAATTAALTGAVHADLIVYHASAVGQEPTFSPRAAADLRGVPGVRQVVEVRTGQARVEGARTTVDAVDPGVIGQVLRLRLRSGSLADLRDGSVLVSAGPARRNGWRVGEAVTIELPRSGRARYRIAGVYDDTPLLVDYVLDLDSYGAGYARQRTRAAYLLTNRDARLQDPGAAASPIRRVLGRYQNLGAASVADYTANLRQEAQFRSTLLQGLLWFVSLIALLGVANTQALSVVERAREIGLLRAIGMRPRQVARMIRAETLVVGLLGTVLGLLVGLAMAWLAARALPDVPGGAPLVVPAGGLLGSALVAVVASVLAARTTARRATRMNVLRAIAVE
jgi:putative ABC transport system permease protein